MSAKTKARRAVEVIDFFDPELSDAKFEKWHRAYYGLPDPKRFTARPAHLDPDRERREVTR